MSNKTGKKLCYYHANCFDGMAAAWSVWKFAPDFEFIPIDYQNDMVVPEGIDGASVMIVDFSFTEAVMDQILQRAYSVVLLDHHPRTAGYIRKLATERRYLEWFKDTGEVVAGGSIDDVTTRMTFSLTLMPHQQEPIEDSSVVDSRNIAWLEYDSNRSGAQMTWDQMSGSDSSVPPLVAYISDYDRWAFKLPNTREVIYGLGQYDIDLEVYKNFMEEPGVIDRFINEAPTIRSVRQALIANTIKITQRIVNFAEHFVPLINIPKSLTSEALDILDEKYDFAVSYYDTSTHRNFSLRSREGGIKVNGIAQMYGGNGHEHAAGINVPRNTQDPHLLYLLSL